MTWTLITGLLSQTPLGWSQGGVGPKLGPRQVAYRRMDVVLVSVPAGTRFSDMVCSQLRESCPVTLYPGHKGILDPGKLDLLLPYNIVDPKALAVGGPYNLKNYYVLNIESEKNPDGTVRHSSPLYIPFAALTPNAQSFYQNQRMTSVQLDWSAFEDLRGEHQARNVAAFFKGVMESFPEAKVDGQVVAGRFHAS